MKIKVNFFIFLFFSSCSIASKTKTRNACSFKTVSLSYKERTDSTAKIELQKLGNKYLSFVISSCSIIDRYTVRLQGYVYNFDVSAGNGMLKLQGVKIIEAINSKDEELLYKSLLGITGQNGEFDIKVSIENPKMYILVGKENYNPCSIQLLK